MEGLRLLKNKDMRPIKFRAWDKDKKEIREVTGINWYDEYIWVDETPMSGDKLSIENTPLMQFTGLLDKNGKEIYESDLVTARHMDSPVDYDTYEVIWHGNKTSACFLFKNKKGIAYHYYELINVELTGNVYEN